MKNRNLICRLLFFVALLALALSIAACAMAESADPCPEGLPHKGPFSYRNRVNATCTTDGHHDKYCDACGRFVGTEIISHIGHQFESRVTITTQPTCLEPGVKQTSSVCKVCQYNNGTVDETIPALGHDYPSTWTRTKEPTCTEKGVEVCVCRRDPTHIKTRDVDALGHDYGPFNITKQPTCTEPGERTSVCRNDASHVQKQEIPPIGHKWDSGKVTKQPNCTEPGVRTYTCENDPTHTRTETIPIVPDAHQWDGGKVTKQPNCTEPGVRTYTCLINPAHTRTESIPIVPDAHDWGTPTVTKQPTCEEPGVRTTVCRLNPAHVKTETIPPTGHKWDKGVVTKQPTLTEEGEKKYTCQNDPSHTKTEKLDRLTMGNNTVCAFGPRLRADAKKVSLPYISTQWYMYTPFDASKDGVQTFDLIATNRFIVGSVTLTIKDGNLMIDYKLNDQKNFNITLEFFTVLNTMADINQYEPEQLLDLRLTRNKAYNLAENFGDDTNLVLYFCSRCDYTYSNRYQSLNYESNANVRLLRNMLDLID